MKATAIAPSNIAFIKYWGRKDEELRLPENGSIAMNLSNLQTITTVEFIPELKNDEMAIDGKKETGVGLKRVIRHLNRIRSLTKIKSMAKAVSENNFPRATGLSSSASGFAALTLAASKAAGLDLNEKELSILARQGSGSACRSIPSGFVEWLDGNTNSTSCAISIFPEDYWQILDVVVIVSYEKKEILTSEGQKLAKSSIFFPLRQRLIKNKIKECKRLIKNKDFRRFGELIEAEALELHAVMLTSEPSLIYWLPFTIKLINQVKSWRKEGIEVYFTLNTGQNLHLIVEEKDKDIIVKKLKKFKEIIKVIVNKPSIGARLTNKHLF
ncbi:diphosphomevalonate decarboxylase [Candidatus Roizmanbacteria bacterium RIFCSPHIGHO2_01_FULL_39_12c]|uniref:diphosphomevalonate decarboxylase n=1 Tax=Candidatus Roizmanbacteria bacterium RIFCSPHIGHO2_01_FULL_39_12c TaxID=1802031 RepID=A0A1F7GBD8_9BACT|nr:MAG: diphosphomevalonate decarboxylase [Candidatus Roizmanbacteria bacterium RIFCSPHIGHO2_01_FULL_39_12c]OGK47871.1 MAG: diphosphomevalonate decarboxylase [Candidatus Roizmanbacteria bacterium RIFCSPLOWO2_01_FULL_40_13]